MSNEPLPDAVCPSCGRQGQVARFQRHEHEDIRGFPVEVTKTLRRCGACAAEWENTRDPDWRTGAYDKFRAAKGWVTPERIRAWRRDYDLSQEEVGRLLGWGEVTLGRYERGSLQTESHNSQLAALLSEGGIARALSERPDALPDTKKRTIREKLAAKYSLPTPGEVVEARDRTKLTLGEAGSFCWVSADTWAAWEAGRAFPDARAARLIRIMLSSPDVAISFLRKDPASIADAALPAGSASRARRPARQAAQSAEAKAFWTSAKSLGFRPKKLRELFPDWTAEAEANRTACLELGAFAQVHAGLQAGLDGSAKLMPFPRPHLKATRHQGNPAHLAAVSMSIAVARLVAKAVLVPWVGRLPAASEVRTEILRCTNRGWVDFENLASYLWSVGVPVIYLPDLPVAAKGMDGMVVRAEGRPVIVLCRDQPLSDWMLFTLGHEGGHIGCGHLAEEEGSTFVDEKVSEAIEASNADGVGGLEASARSDDLRRESEANAYAQAVLVEHGGLLSLTDRIPSAEQMAAEAIEFGTLHGISPGHVVLNVMRHTPNPPFNLVPLAMSTLKLIDQKLLNTTTEETCKTLARAHIEPSRLRPESAAFLQAIGAW